LLHWYVVVLVDDVTHTHTHEYHYTLVLLAGVCGFEAWRRRAAAAGGEGDGPGKGIDGEIPSSCPWDPSPGAFGEAGVDGGEVEVLRSVDDILEQQHEEHQPIARLLLRFMARRRTAAR